MKENRKPLKKLFLEAARLLQQDCPQNAADVCLSLTGVFYLRCCCDRYDTLAALPEGSGIGAAIQETMGYMESQNSALTGVFPTDYEKYSDKILAKVLKLFDHITVQDLEDDALGAAYEAYLYWNAKAATDAHGVAYTPASMTQLMVNILEPDRGVLLDPACGSGRMFLHSAKYPGSELTFYGQELMETTARLCIMNLMIHGLQGKIAYGSDGNTLYCDAHDLEGKCDFVLANPPFNLKNVDTEAVLQAGRLAFGLPTSATSSKIRNTNYLWLSYCYAYLNEKGRAGVVMLSSATEAKGEPRRIRRELVETGHLEVMLSAGNRFFQYHNQGSSLWFINKGRPVESQDTTLFIDARAYSTKMDRTRHGWNPWQIKNLTAIVWLYRGEVEKYRALLDEYRNELKKCAIELSIPALEEKDSFAEMLKSFFDMCGRIQFVNETNEVRVNQAISTVKEAAWLYDRFGDGEYRDIPGLCKRVSRAEIEKQEYSLNPATYVGFASQQGSDNVIPEHSVRWKEIRLADVADMRDGMNFKNESYGDGVGIIMVSDFQNRYYPDCESLVQLQEKYVKPENYLNSGDIVIARSNGTAELVGRCMLIPSTPRPLTFCHNCIRLRLRDPDQFDPRFFTYLLKTKNFRQAMASLAKDGCIKNISQQSLMNHSIRVPDILYQRKIATTLRHYDADIESGEQQIKRLKEDASKVYQKWFVQHEYPGFENQEIHPAEWPSVPLDSILDLHYTVEPAGTVPGDIPLYSSKGLLRYVDTPLLQGEHVLIPRKGNLSNVMLINDSFRTNDTVFYGCPRIPNTAKYIYYFLCSYGVEKLDSGGRKPQINKARLKRVMVPMPDAALLEQFEKKEEAYRKEIESLEAEIKRLEHTRDEMIEELIGKFSGTVSGTN